MSLKVGATGFRSYLPDTHSEKHYRPNDELVSMVRVFDKGPDVLMEVYIRSLKAGSLLAPAADEAEMRRRLFADPPAGDAEAVRVMLQELEDCAAAHHIEGTRLARRRLAAFIGQLRIAAAAKHAEVANG